MAEKKKKSPPKFGGKRALKDTSGDGKITFADTFLGDLLGLDGKVGTKGKAGLLKSLRGARRMKDGVETSKRPKARPKAVKKKDPKDTVGRGGAGRGGPLANRKAPKDTVGRGGAGRGGPLANRKDPKDTVGRGGAGRGGPLANPRDPGTSSNPIPINPKTPTRAEKKASQKRMMKLITLDKWKELSPSERVMRGLPKNNQAVFGLTGALTLGAGLFTDAFKANRGGLAKKSGYMYGGSVTKKKPLTKMSKGGMVKKK